MLGSFDKMPTSVTNAEAQKQLGSIKTWANDFDYEINGATSYLESLDSLAVNNILDRDTSDLLNVFLERDTKGFDVDIDGEPLKHKDLGKGVEDVRQVLNWWFHRIKSGEISDPKTALKEAIQKWKVMVVPKINKVKELVKNAARLQAYCGKPGYEKIRNELDKKYGFEKFESIYSSSKVIGFVIDMDEFGKFRRALDDGLYDLLNPEFADTLPALLKNGELNLPKIFDQEPFLTMIASLPKEFGFIIKKIASSSTLSPQKIDNSLSKLIVDFISSDAPRPSAKFHPNPRRKAIKNRLTPELQAKLDDARENLNSQGFVLDNQKETITDPNGNEIFNGGEEYLDVVYDLSNMIDRDGYEEAMDRVRAHLRKRMAE